MNDQLIFRNDDSNKLSTETISKVDIAIAAWLHSKSNRSGSNKTKVAYETTVQSFRAILQGQSHDLDTDPDYVATIAQGWAELRSDDSHHHGKVSNATYNQRLAILSSFYNFARKRRYIRSENPIELVERRKAVSPNRAVAVEAKSVAEALTKIDRTTKQGQRDYALLLVALTTGYRLSELASLRGQDVVISGGEVRLFFRRVKGGRTSYKPLGTIASKALLTYLRTEYGSLIISPEVPIWVNYSRHNPGEAISIQTIADICERHLGTSKVHALRHTFAQSMVEQGAKVTEIKAELGHKSLATTTTYLEGLAKPYNPYADAIAEMFGASED